MHLRRILVPIERARVRCTTHPKTIETVRGIFIMHRRNEKCAFYLPMEKKNAYIRTNYAYARFLDANESCNSKILREGKIFSRRVKYTIGRIYILLDKFFFASLIHFIIFTWKWKLLSLKISAVRSTSILDLSVS